ncbi:glutathione S-transferase II [Coniochaeta sp. 2T2.1]|nr:glutathione S-transferase II [Coniochaeta sp. 2T2.1]
MASGSNGEPTGLKATSGIELITVGTPNGVKASIFLEELKAAYGTEYNWQGIAILLYLARHYDTDNKFSFPVDSDEYSELEQWIGWQHGGLGPMQGQANHFVRFAKSRPSYAVQRFVGETERLYGILDSRLSTRKYVVGDKFTVADIAIVGWANLSTLAGIDLDQFPKVKAWYGRLLERPAIRSGLAIPNESPVSNAALARKLEEGGEEERPKAEATRNMIADAKEEFAYKYASP